MSFEKSNTNRLILFIHLPKTAGTTLLEMVTRFYPPENIQLLYENDAYVETKLSEDRQGQIKCVYGHFSFGLHQYASRPFTYVTMLREPIERSISLYYFKKPEHNQTLRQFFNSNYLPKYNHQTYLLAGGCYDLKRAKENLQKYFSVVGLTERFVESLFLMKKEFGWHQIASYWFSNVTANRLKKEQIPQDEIELIRKNNELDLQLYTFASELFEEKMKTLDPLSRNELDQFMKHIKKI